MHAASPGFLSLSETLPIRFSPSRHCTVVLTVAVLLARLGSGVSSVAVAFSVMTVPEGAVTFTIRRTVHVVFGAMALFS